MEFSPTAISRSVCQSFHQKIYIAFALSISTVGVITAPARAQYETFEPPFGFYLNYQCEDELAVKLWASQGGLALNLAQSGQEMATWALADPVAAPGNNDYMAWKYVFQHPESEDVHIVLYDYWYSDDEEGIQIVEATNDQVLDSVTCRVIGGGVNPNQ